MQITETNRYRKFARRALIWITEGYRPIAFIPLLLAITHWAAGEQIMITVAAVLPAAAVLLSLFPDRRVNSHDTDALQRSYKNAEHWLEEKLRDDTSSGARFAVLALKFDRLDLLEDRLGFAMDDSILEDFCARLEAILRTGDFIVRGKRSDFLVCVSGVRAPESENLLHLARRIQTCLDEPFCNA